MAKSQADNELCIAYILFTLLFLNYTLCCKNKWCSFTENWDSVLFFFFFCCGDLDHLSTGANSSVINGALTAHTFWSMNQRFKEIDNFILQTYFEERDKTLFLCNLEIWKGTAAPITVRGNRSNINSWILISWTPKILQWIPKSFKKESRRPPNLKTWIYLCLATQLLICKKLRCITAKSG